MALANLHRSARPVDGPEAAEATLRGERRAWWVLQAVIAAEGSAVGVIVAIDGSPGWRVARLVVTLTATASAIWHVGHDRRAGRGWTVLAVGLVGILVGAGIGFPHAMKEGLSTVTVAGQLGLVAGLALVVAGAVLLLRPLSGLRRLWALPVAFLVLQFVLLPGTGALVATNVPDLAPKASTPADHGLTYHDVELRTSDGVRLAAWYVPSANGAAVVLLHGAGSTRSSTLPHAAVLARHGYGVLLVDTRGHGASEGRAMDFGWYGDLDLGAAVDFLAGAPGVAPDRLGAVGMSMGGEQAIGAAAGDERLRAVVAEGATGRTRADQGWLDHDLQGSVHRLVDTIQYGAADLLTEASPPISLRDAVRAAAPRPLLVIAGGEGDEITVGRYLRDASPGSVELAELPDTPHTDGLVEHPQEWEERVIAFLDRHLG